MRGFYTSILNATIEVIIKCFIYKHYDYFRKY